MFSEPFKFLLKGQSLFSDYMGKYFLTGLGKCAEESCQLLVKSGTPQMISLYLPFGSTTSLVQVQNMGLEEIQGAYVPAIKCDPGNF